MLRFLADPNLSRCCHHDPFGIEGLHLVRSTVTFTSPGCLMNACGGADSGTRRLIRHITPAWAS
jgi:hypothetical protein